MFDRIKQIFFSFKDGKDWKPMSDAEFASYHQKLYAELPQSIKTRGIEILHTYLPQNDLPLVSEQIRQYGTVIWIVKIQEHFGWGMAVRNLLRQHGLTDDMLPLPNWDEYYVMLVEDACESLFGDRK